MDAKRIPKKKKVEIAEEVVTDLNAMPQTTLVTNGIKLYDTSRHYINKNTVPSSSTYSSVKAPSPYSPLVTTPRQDLLPSTTNKSKGQPNGKDVSTGHKRNANGEPIWVQDLRNSIEKNKVLQQCSRSIIDIHNEDPIFKWGSFYNFTPIATIDSTEAIQTSLLSSTITIDKSTKPTKKSSKASSTRSKSKSDLAVPSSSSTSNTNSDSSQSYINTTNTISLNMYSIYDKDGNELPELIETNGYLRNVINFATGQPPPAITGDAPDVDKVTITPYNMHKALHWWGVKSDPMLLAAITDREQQRQRLEAERLAAVRQQELLVQQQELTLMKYEDDHMMAILFEEFKQEQAELARRRAEEEEENNRLWAAQQQQTNRPSSQPRQHYSQQQPYQPYQQHQMPRGPRPAAPYYKASSGFPRGQPVYVQPEYGYAPSSSHTTFPQPRPARYAPPANGGQRSNYASHFTAPSTPVVAVIVPRGPRGPRGYHSHQQAYGYQQGGQQQPQYEETTQQPYYKDRNSAVTNNYGGYGSASTSQGHNYGQRISQSSYSNKFAQPIHGGNYRTSNGHNYDPLSTQHYQGESTQNGGSGHEWNPSDVATGQNYDSYQLSTQPNYGVYSSGGDTGTHSGNTLSHGYSDHTKSNICPAEHSSSKAKSQSIEHPTRQRDVYTDVQPKVKPTSDQSTTLSYTTTHHHDTVDTLTLPVPESSHKDRSEHKGGGEHKERSGDNESREHKHSKKDRDRDRDGDRDSGRDRDREGKEHKRHRHSSHSGDDNDDKKRSKESKDDKEPKEGKESKHRHREHKSPKSSSSSSHRHRSSGHKSSSGHNSDTSGQNGGHEE